MLLRYLKSLIDNSVAELRYTKEYDVTDVNKVDNHSETKEVSRYSLDGQRLASPTKGINIVRYGDGSIKKEMVE